MLHRARKVGSSVSNGRTGRAGFALGFLVLTLYAAGVTPLIELNPLGAGPLAVPLVLAVCLLVTRRGHDLGISAAAVLSAFVTAIWSAEVIAMNYPAISSVRMLPLLALLILPGETGANRYGSSRTVQ